MQFLGIFGILQETYKIIYKRRKIISQITLFLVLPLSLFFLAYNQISNHMIQNFLFQIIQAKSQKGHPRFLEHSRVVMQHEVAYFLLFVIVYNIFLSIISIPCISIITYIVACEYTKNDNEKASFKESLKIVIKVWKRVIITSFYSLGISFTYDLVAACVLLIVQATIFRYKFYWHIKASILIVFMVMYVVGSLYLSTIWMLSKVVCVLEEPYGFKALMKSQRLLRGKMMVATILTVSMILFVGVVQFLFNKVVVNRVLLLGMISKIVLEIFCLVLLSYFLLLKFVVLTILYFVCKSYHQENINMRDYLLDYVKVYVSLKANDVRVEI
ncbi:hypothetical protein IC582_005379 [Cucumis melo]